MSLKVKLGIALALLVLVGGIWYQGSRADDRLAQARADADKAQAKSDLLISQLNEQNKTLADQNTQLAASNAALQSQIGALQSSVLALRRETATRVAQVPTLTAAQRAQATAAEISVDPAQITVEGDGLLLSSVASQRNLETLITGASARKELDLSRQNIALLEQQKQNLEQQLANVTLTVANKDKQIDSLTGAYEARLKAKDAEIADVKAKARKRMVVVAVVAAIGGYLLKGRI